jgi:hypothetical protein
VILSNHDGVVVGCAGIVIAVALGLWTWARAGKGRPLAVLVVGSVLGCEVLGEVLPSVGVVVIAGPLIVGLAAGRVRGVLLGPLTLMVGCGLAALLWGAALLIIPTGEVSRGRPVDIALALAFSVVLTGIFFVGGCAGAFLWGPARESSSSGS